mgnify:CR=1 FL=1|tara:strand:+ start:83341 stop:83973 length:633 start_codon:yes stop_codon:yes gene_type:complete
MEGKIKLTKTYRYFTHGDPEKAEHIWIVLHGYGQLAEFFIRKFRSLDDNHFIIAPEGMHRFYLQGTSGRVGASWMTKEARLDDIEDNHLFLDELVGQFTSKYTFQKRTILGFSQGGATASRWHQRNSFNADNLILWACVFPPDLESSYSSPVFQGSKNYFVLGKQDEYFQEKYYDIIKTYKDQLPNLSIREFEGPHNIDQETLISISKEL